VEERAVTSHRELDELQLRSPRCREPSKTSPTMGLARELLRSRNGNLIRPCCSSSKNGLRASSASYHK